MITRLKSLLTPGILASLWVSFGSITSSIIAAVALIINSRLLGPTQYGIFSAQFSLILLLARISDLGINLTIQRAISKSHSQQHTSQLFQTGLILKLLSWILTILICTLFAVPLNQYFFQKISPQTITIIGFLVIFTLLYDYVVTIVQSLHKFSLSNAINISLSSFKLLGILILAGLGLLTGTTVFWLYAFTSSGASLISGSTLPWGKQLISKKDFLTTTQNIIPVAKWVSLAVIAAAIADNADVLLIQRFMTNYETGLYSAATRITTFASLIGMALGTVASIRVAKYQTISHLNQYLKKAILLSVAAPIIMSLAALFAPWVILFTSGSDYLPAVIPLQILLVAVGIDIATSPFIALYYLIEKPQFYFFSGLILIITLLTGNFLLIPQYGMIGSAIAKLITRLVLLTFTCIYTYRAYRQHEFKIAN